jgi:intein-encoded DNA endonuclease-like protein
MEKTGAYLCGLLCAAGRIELNHESGNYYISLGTSRWEMVEIFSDALEKCVGKPRVYTSIREHGDESRVSYRVVKYGKDAVERFVARWGISAATDSWAVPGRCAGNEELGVMFLRGFFDCEGVVAYYIKKTKKGKHKIRRVRCTSANRGGLVGVRSLLKGIGIKSSLYGSGPYFCLDIEGKTRLDLFRGRVGFTPGYKKARLDGALAPLSV